MSIDPSVTASEASATFRVTNTADGSVDFLQCPRASCPLGLGTVYRGSTNPTASCETSTYSGVVRQGEETFQCTVTVVEKSSTHKVFTVFGQLPAAQSAHPQVLAAPSEDQISPMNEQPSRKVRTRTEQDDRFRPLTGDGPDPDQPVESSDQHAVRRGDVNEDTDRSPARVSGSPVSN